MDPFISKLSPHLFWDVDEWELDLTENEAFIVQRVLEYGLMSDWILLKHQMGIAKIANISKNLRTLDKKALAFISALSKIPRNEFRCYTTKS